MDIKYEILYQYPFPIAVTYLNADNAREAVGAHDQRIRLFEVTLKFLASIAIAQYLSDRLDDARVKQVLRGLVRPSLGQWNGFLREILSAYERANRIQDMFISEMFDAYNQKERNRPAMIRAYNEVRNFVENRTDSGVTSLSVRQFFDKLIEYRNKTVGHGVTTRYHCERMNGPLFDALEEMLGQLTFLREYRLVYIDDVRVRRGNYAHEMMSFMGSTPPSRMKEAYITDDPEEYKVEEQLYLCSRGANVPVLSLHPLVIALREDVLFLNESERERGIEYLSYQRGQIKKPDRLLEDFKEILGFVMGEDVTEPSFERMREQATSAPVASPTAYEKGCAAFDQENWAGAMQWLEAVSEAEAEYADAQSRLQEARHQQALLDRYNQGQGSMAKRRWEAAEAAFEELEKDAPGYRDVRELLETVKLERAQEAHLTELYSSAREALAAQQWSRAYDLLKRLDESRPGFRDVGDLLSHQQRLQDLYDQAIESIAAKRWLASQTALSQLEALEPDYRNAASLMERTKEELETEAQLASWYSEAKSHMALEQWQNALRLLDQIHDLQADYQDVEELIQSAQEKILVACPGCGTLNPSSYKFCGKCGAPLQVWICWHCQSPVAENRRFCGQCGAPRQKPEAVTCPRCKQVNPLGRKYCGKCGFELNSTR